MKIAVDFDEVLFLLVEPMIEWHDQLYGTKLNYEDFCNYRFHEAIKSTEKEASRRYIDFALSEYSLKTPPIVNAHSVLSKRKAGGDTLHIATSSQIEVVEAKKNRLEKHFGGLFDGFHYTNYYSLIDGPIRSKAEICQELGIDIIIDDNPEHLTACTGCVQTLILFGDYPWNKGDYPGFMRAANWTEVEQILNSRL